MNQCAVMHRTQTRVNLAEYDRRSVAIVWPKKKQATNWKIGNGNQISWFHLPLDGVYLCMCICVCVSVCSCVFAWFDLHKMQKDLFCCSSSFSCLLLLFVLLVLLKLFLDSITKLNDIYGYLYRLRWKWLVVFIFPFVSTKSRKGEKTEQKSMYDHNAFSWFVIPIAYNSGFL